MALNDFGVLMRNFLCVLICAFSLSVDRVVASEMHSVIVEFQGNKIDLSGIGKSIDDIDGLSACVNSERDRGRLTNAQALVLLSRITKVDDVRVPGHPFHFHGDSWVSFGHWSENLDAIKYIIFTALEDDALDKRIEAEIDGQLIKAGLAARRDGFIHYRKLPLWGGYRKELIAILTGIERKWAEDPRFTRYQVNPIFADETNDAPCGGLKLIEYK